MRQLLRIIAMITVLYGGACVYLYSFQESIIFKPDGLYQPPDRSALPDINEVTITTEDGIALTSWYQPPPEGARTVLYLHGNANGLTKRTGFYEQIIAAGYGLLALDYRGYSRNAGTPSEAGLIKDGHAGMAFLKTQGTSPENVILIGRSLGSGVAVELAMHHNVAAIALISPYASIAQLAHERYPFMPVSLILKHPFDSLSKAPYIHTATFIFHGTSDRIIPVHHAQILYDAIPEPLSPSMYDKSLNIYEGLNHSNLPFTDVLAALAPYRTTSQTNRQ